MAEVGVSHWSVPCRHTLESGEVQLVHNHGQLTLCLKCPSEQLQFTLFELSAAERRIAQKTLLFSMWEQLSSTQAELKGGS